jgi:hypothetical protein
MMPVRFAGDLDLVHGLEGIGPGGCVLGIGDTLEGEFDVLCGDGAEVAGPFQPVLQLEFDLRRRFLREFLAA